jgi:hypothetical protein
MKIEFNRRKSDAANNALAAYISNIRPMHAIEKVRNGVREPNINGDNRPIWNAFDELRKLGAEPSEWTARKLAGDMQLSANSGVVTFYLWKQFHGKDANV